MSLQESHDEGKELRVSFWLHWLRRPGYAVPLVYGLSSTIGMLFYWTYFQRFGIDILAYIDPSDLLLASFRRPIVWLILLLSILTVHLDNLSSARFGSRPRSRWTRWYGTPGYRRANLGVGALLAVVCIVGWAQHSADQVRSGGGAVVQLQFAEDGSRLSGQLIGTTSRFLFLHDEASGVSQAYPLENLRAIATVLPASQAPQPSVQAPAAASAAPTGQSD